MNISESLPTVNLTLWSVYLKWKWTGNLTLGESQSFAGTLVMSFQVGIGSLSGTVFFSGGTLYPSANYDFYLYVAIDMVFIRKDLRSDLNHSLCILFLFSNT